MKNIGIFGAGQLGKMIAIAAHNMGFHPIVFSESEDSPAVNVVKDYVVAPFFDKLSLSHFIESVDVLTFESENIPIDCIKFLKDKGLTTNLRAIEVAQNRALEKEFLTRNNIKTTDYKLIQSEEDLKKLEFPILLKTVQGGYDGKGQLLIEESLHSIDVSSLKYPLIAEKVVQMEKEVSVIVARNKLGTVCFPVAENVHKEGILITSTVPAGISKSTKGEVLRIATKIAELLDITGVICVEFFLNTDNELLVNELAPRPHNSGHWSMDCCDINQFEALILAITGHKLREPSLLMACSMTNIIGNQIDDYFSFLEMKNVRAYNYGKNEVQDKRKMGHFTTLLVDQDN